MFATLHFKHGVKAAYLTLAYLSKSIEVRLLFCFLCKNNKLFCKNNYVSLAKSFIGRNGAQFLDWSVSARYLAILEKSSYLCTMYIYLIENNWPKNRRVVTLQLYSQTLIITCH